MDIGIRICYLIKYGKNNNSDIINRQSYVVGVVNGVYRELTKTSILFSFLLKSGFKENDVVSALL